jgi:hypothetical protein
VPPPQPVCPHAAAAAARTASTVTAVVPRCCEAAGCEAVGCEAVGCEAAAKATVAVGAVEDEGRPPGPHRRGRGREDEVVELGQAGGEGGRVDVTEEV